MSEVQVDPSFMGAGLVPGLQLWRIENMNAVRFPDVTGKFYNGDSYILLATFEKGDGSQALVWNVHFWLGSKTSVDERGLAAYKAVELDDSLGGAPVQYREVEGHESELFLSYFKDIGIQYLEGGVSSGFKHVERGVYETRLLKLKGNRTVRVSEVEISATSLNLGDVFILDKGEKLYIWYGPYANRSERAKALTMAQRIISGERGGRGKIIIVDDDHDAPAFWETLGGKMTITDMGEDDDSYERETKKLQLYRLSDASGSMVLDPIPLVDEKIQRSMLKTEDVFILDVGTHIFVWIGRGATRAEKREGMVKGAEFVERQNYPPYTPVTRIIEGSEDAMFKSHFETWEPPLSFNFGNRPSQGVANIGVGNPIDYRALHSRKAKEDTMVDDGSGKVEIWRVEDLDLAEWPEEKYGQFYAGDSFVVLYTYNKGSSKQYLIYFWLGYYSTQDEQATAALKATELDDSLGGLPVQIRVTQGKEPSHFRSLFKGGMIVHTGGRASGFKNVKDTDSYDSDGVALFHIKGSNQLNTYAIQVDELASSLNSGDCFVLITPAFVYQWYGNSCSAEEKNIAKSVALKLNNYLDVYTRNESIINEGDETEEFWDALGGQGDYAVTREGEILPQDPRLFQISNQTGYMRVDEIPNFAQDDLIVEDVMLLDTVTTVFIWIGDQANETEKRECFDIALQYIDNAEDGRDPDTPVVKVAAGSEPLLFTQHFRGWDPNYFESTKFIDPYEEKLRQIHTEYEEDDPNVVTLTSSALPASDFLDPSSNKFTPEELTTQPYPEGVDPTRRVEYLSEEDFSAVFGMDRTAFAALKEWKRKKLLRDTNFF